MPVRFEDHQPETLDEAVAILIDNMSDDERKYIRENGIDGLHHFFGRAMRNGWGLWNPKTPLVLFFRNEYGIGHADDMSGMILDGMNARVTGKEFSPAVEAIKYREYWRKQNCDPMTGERAE